MKAPSADFDLILGPVKMPTPDNLTGLKTVSKSEMYCGAKPLSALWPSRRILKMILY